MKQCHDDHVSEQELEKLSNKEKLYIKFVQLPDWAMYVAQWLINITNDKQRIIEQVSFCTVKEA